MIEYKIINEEFNASLGKRFTVEVNNKLAYFNYCSLPSIGYVKSIESTLKTNKKDNKFPFDS
jgi:UDP-galactopyranose mutase